MRLIERGDHPRLTAVAREAGVSRATAYRYFPSERAMLLEVPLDRDFAPAEEVLSGHEQAPVVDRVLTVQRYVFDHGAAHEAQFRVFFAAIHELAARDEAPRQPLRAGRRRQLLEQALAPLRAHVPRKDLQQLRDALVALTGADALFVMRDVCGLTPRRGRSLMAWASRRLVEATMQEHGVPIA